MSNEFDLGLNIASIETELPDPVITLTGSDNLTAAETAEMPLLALTAYGRSTQGYASHGGVPLGKNLFDSSLIKTSTNSGVTCRNNNDGTFSFSGTLSSGIEFTTFAISRSSAKSKTVISEPGMYTISGIPSGTSGIYAYINLYYNGEGQYSFIHTNGGNTKEITSEMLSYDDFRFDIGFMVNGAFNEQTYYIQLEKNNVPTSFEPYYSNPNPDCPVPIESIGDSGSLTVTTQDGTAINISDIGIEGYGLPVSSGGNYTDDNGQQWICDKLVVNADGTGKIIKHTKTTQLSSQKGYWKRANDYSVERYYTPKHYFADDWAYPHKPFLTHFDRNKDGKEIGGITVGNNSIGLAFAEYGTTTVDDFKLFLDNNEVTAIYPVTTPSETELKPEQVTALQPLIDKYGAFTAYFMSTQDGIPTPENPVEIVSTADLYRTKTATITTGLPLRGIPVDIGGNYTDSSGQEWICDTLEHIYGEPAQITKRVETAHFKSVMETHGCDAVLVTKNTADHFVYFGRYGRYFKNSTLKYYLYECLWEERYNVDTGELIYSVEGDGKNRVAEFAHRIYGKWTVENTDEPVSFAEPLWELDNGKPIPAEYICETGTFVNGAEVIYPCGSKILQLTTKETEALNTLSGFTGSTTIYNDNTAEMTVKLLREDFEMQYIHWIKESQSFVCEKTGKYKIICVGGGSSGGVGAPETAETLQAAGTTTSFGNIISAEGGGKTKATLTALNFSEVVVGGQSGYDGINYGSTSHVMACDSSVHFTSAGGNSSVMWGTGHGYGAGGGARAYSSDLVAAGGRCGKVESTIVDLEENQIIACTIGGGGVLKLSDANVLDYLKTYVDKETTSASGMGEKVSACVSDGADGVIIIQYLGV